METGITTRERPRPRHPIKAGPGEAPPPRREPVFNLPPGCAVLHRRVRRHRMCVTVPRADDGAGLLRSLVRGAFIPIRYCGRRPSTSHRSPARSPIRCCTAASRTLPSTWSGLRLRFTARQPLGTARFVLFWVVTSIAAAALHYVLLDQDQSPLVGAFGRDLGR